MSKKMTSKKLPLKITDIMGTNSCVHRIQIVSGRKPVIQTIVLFGGISAMLSAMSWNVEIFATCRFFAGLFIGGFHVCYTLVTECVGSKLRARACFFLFMAHYLGTLFGSTMAYFTMSEDGYGGWRTFILIASAPLLFIFVMVTFLCPESPRFLMVSGKSDEALEVIQTLNPSANKNTVLSKIQVESRGSLSDLFKSLTNARIITTLAISFAILRFENLGITLMYFEYLQNPTADDCELFVQTYNIEKKCEPLKSDDYLLNIAYTNAQLGAAILSTTMADVFGRRFALIFSTFFGTCAFMSYYFCMPSYLITICAIITKCLALSCVMVMFLFINELFPTYIRSIASGFVDSCSRVGLILSPFIAQFLSKEDFKIALSCYIATGFIAVILFQSIKEETKNQAQVDSDKIEENLKGH